MESLIEVVVKIIPAIAGFIAVSKFVITTINKTLIEILLTPNNIKVWEDFYELIILSLLITTAIFVPGFAINSPVSVQIIKY